MWFPAVVQSILWRFKRFFDESGKFLNQPSISFGGVAAPCRPARSAAAGNVRAAGLILERTEGKVKDSLQVEGPQTVIFRWATGENDLRENRSVKESDVLFRSIESGKT